MRGYCDACHVPNVTHICGVDSGLQGGTLTYSCGAQEESQAWVGLSGASAQLLVSQVHLHNKDNVIVSRISYNFKLLNIHFVLIAFYVSLFFRM